MRPITERQAEVLRTITELAEQKGYAPTIREIGDALGIRSSQPVHQHLRALQRKGYITREPHRARTIRVLRTAEGATDNESG